jgi:pilus assembly protein Flp/PilA
MKNQKNHKNRLQNQRGQGLIEYLIIVALMGVATIAIMRVMGEAVSKRFAGITAALQGDRINQKAKIDESTYKRRDLGNFLNGAGSHGGNSEAGEN